MIYKHNGNIITVDGKWLSGTTVDPYNPLNLPPNTIRCKFKSGYTPRMGDSQTLVDSTNNVWDIYKQSNDWGGIYNRINDLYNFFGSCEDLLEVLGANTSNITNMSLLFYRCTSLTSVALFNTTNVTNMKLMFESCTSLISSPLFDTSNVTNMDEMFSACTSLTNVPLFNTSKVTNMDSMFNACLNVQSGALALYQQASSQTNPPTEHTGTFATCGWNTVTGMAELQQIPISWGGLL